MQMVLQVPYEDIQRGLSEEQLATLKKTGVVIVKGGVPQEVSHDWLERRMYNARHNWLRRSLRKSRAGYDPSKTMWPPTRTK